MKRFLIGLFDFFWPYFAAGILVGTIMALSYGLGGYIKFPGGGTQWDWFKLWFIACAAFTALGMVMSIVFEIIFFLLFMLGYMVIALCKRLRAK